MPISVYDNPEMFASAEAGAAAGAGCSSSNNNSSQQEQNRAEDLAELANQLSPGLPRLKA
jgi:hypothetical protein